MQAGTGTGTGTATLQQITLRGSTEIVKEFFSYAINSILYQRGIYPPESFRRVPKYGLTMLVTSDDGLQEYLQSVVGQLEEWLTNGEVQRFVVVINGADSGQTLERWVFNVETDERVKEAAAAVAAAGPQDDENVGGNAAQPQRRSHLDSITSDKTEKEVAAEIQAIIRQITASVTFLPLLNEPCSFDLLIYTDKETGVPVAWQESDPQYITNAQEVRLRSFTTKIHRVDALVAYRDMADEV